MFVKHSVLVLVQPHYTNTHFVHLAHAHARMSFALNADFSIIFFSRVQYQKCNSGNMDVHLSRVAFLLLVAALSLTYCQSECIVFDYSVDCA